MISMALNLYRRHRRDCKAGHPEDSKSSDLDERKKGWRRCECPIFASGALTRTFRRQSTGKWEWADAKAVAAAWEEAGNWEGKPVPPAPVATAPIATDRVTIADATAAFIAKCQNRGIAIATLKKYKTFVKQLMAYADSRGYVMLDQFTINDMDRFYAWWKDGVRAKAKKLERLKAFVRFCLKRKWIAENITEDLDPPEGSSVPANKTPFTEEEMSRIYAACDKLGAPKPRGPGYRPWGGEDAKDFIMLSVYTGLRISDVATFDITKRLKGNDVFLRMHKTRKELYTWIPDWLVDRLRAREKQHGSLIFRAGETLVMCSLAESWRVKMKYVFKLAGQFEERPTPHRFRHTFVRILLEKGVPVADVAELIGDTEQIVRRHYAKWVPERQARLTKILQSAFEDKPTLRVVSIR
jgi:integrase